MAGLEVAFEHLNLVHLGAAGVVASVSVARRLDIVGWSGRMFGRVAGASFKFSVAAAKITARSAVQTYRMLARTGKVWDKEAAEAITQIRTVAEATPRTIGQSRELLRDFMDHIFNEARSGAVKVEEQTKMRLVAILRESGTEDAEMNVVEELQQLVSRDKNLRKAWQNFTAALGTRPEISTASVSTSWIRSIPFVGNSGLIRAATAVTVTVDSLGNFGTVVKTVMDENVISVLRPTNLLTAGNAALVTSRSITQPVVSGALLNLQNYTKFLNTGTVVSQLNEALAAGATFVARNGGKATYCIYAGSAALNAVMPENLIAGFVNQALGASAARLALAQNAMKTYRAIVFFSAAQAGIYALNGQFTLAIASALSSVQAFSMAHFVLPSIEAPTIAVTQQATARITQAARTLAASNIPEVLAPVATNGTVTSVVPIPTNTNMGRLIGASRPVVKITNPLIALGRPARMAGALRKLPASTFIPHQGSTNLVLRGLPGPATTSGIASEVIGSARALGAAAENEAAMAADSLIATNIAVHNQAAAALPPIRPAVSRPPVAHTVIRKTAVSALEGDGTLAVTHQFLRASSAEPAIVAGAANSAAIAARQATEAVLQTGADVVGSGTGISAGLSVADKARVTNLVANLDTVAKTTRVLPRFPEKALRPDQLKGLYELPNVPGWTRTLTRERAMVHPLMQPVPPPASATPVPAVAPAPAAAPLSPNPNVIIQPPPPAAALTTNPANLPAATANVVAPARAGTVVAPVANLSAAHTQVPIFKTTVQNVTDFVRSIPRPRLVSVARQLQRIHTAYSYLKEVRNLMSLFSNATSSVQGSITASAPYPPGNDVFSDDGQLEEIYHAMHLTVLPFADNSYYIDEDSISFVYRNAMIAHAEILSTYLVATNYQNAGLSRAQTAAGIAEAGLATVIDIATSKAMAAVGLAAGGLPGFLIGAAVGFAIDAVISGLMLPHFSLPKLLFARGLDQNFWKFAAETCFGDDVFVYLLAEQERTPTAEEVRRDPDYKYHSQFPLYRRMLELFDVILEMATYPPNRTRRLQLFMMEMACVNQSLYFFDQLEQGFARDALLPSKFKPANVPDGLWPINRVWIQGTDDLSTDPRETRRAHWQQSLYGIDYTVIPWIYEQYSVVASPRLTIGDSASDTYTSEQLTNAFGFMLSSDLHAEDPSDTFDIKEWGFVKMFTAEDPETAIVGDHQDSNIPRYMDDAAFVITDEDYWNEHAKQITPGRAYNLILAYILWFGNKLYVENGILRLDMNRELEK